MHSQPARNMEKSHSCFFRCPVSFFKVASPAAATKVVPCPGATPALGQDMVQRQNYLDRLSVHGLGRAFFCPAVLAKIPVPSVDV